MKHFYAFALLVSVAFSSFAQYEEVGDITRYNFPAKGKANNKTRSTSPSNTIDSTFTYIPDTISLPLFDDFSISHFQQYEDDPSQPGTTQTSYYKLLDLNGNPLPANTLYTTQVTYKTLVNTETNTTSSTNFTPVQVKYANFTSYPVTYTTTNAYPPYIIIDTITFPNPPDTIWLNNPEIYQDSATIFTVQLNDPDSYWIDSYAHHNYTMAIDPWSLGVATFDGLDENGYPYNFGSVSQGVADYLTSKFIDMSGYSPADSVYLSFLIQRGGYGNVPEANDSLVVEFYNSISSGWERAWSYKGGNDISNWKVANLKVVKPQYFTGNFRLRFKNYSGTSGDLDHFHIDYVNLRANGGYQDSIFEDFAWSYVVGSLVRDYTSVPWEHWKNNFAGKMNDKVKVSVHNSYPVAKNPAISQVQITHPQTGTSTVMLNNFIMTEESPTADYAPFSSANSLHDFSAVNQFDPSIAGPEASFDIRGLVTIQEPTYTHNDTCYATQYFGDYYSYDDGSAEKAYGVVGAQARLAIKFTAYEEDTLLGVRMHFVPSVVDVSDKLFMLTVWEDNNGVPGNVLYEDDFFNPRSPVYEQGYGEFTTYYFKNYQRLKVPQTFYVGWKQVDAERLNIGLDMNNPSNTKTFFSVDGASTWHNSSFLGSVMMRPIVNTRANFDLSVGENEAELTFEVFPNPTNGAVSIDWRNNEPFPGAVCRDAQGRVVGIIEKTAGKLSIDLSAVPAGVYFIQLETFGAGVKKVVKY